MYMKCFPLHFLSKVMELSTKNIKYQADSGSDNGNETIEGEIQSATGCGIIQK